MKRRARIVLLGAGMLAACTRFTPAEEEKAEAGTDAAPEGTADATGSTDAATTDGNRARSPTTRQTLRMLACSDAADRSTARDACSSRA